MNKQLFEQHSPPWSVELSEDGYRICVRDACGKMVFEEDVASSEIDAHLLSWRAVIALVSQQPLVERLIDAAKIAFPYVDREDNEPAHIAYESLKAALAAFDSPIQPCKPRYPDEAVRELIESAKSLGEDAEAILLDVKLGHHLNQWRNMFGRMKAAVENINKLEQQKEESR